MSKQREAMEKPAAAAAEHKRRRLSKISTRLSEKCFALWHNRKADKSNEIRKPDKLKLVTDTVKHPCGCIRK